MIKEVERKVIRSRNIALRPYRGSDVPLVVEAVWESIDEAEPYVPWIHPNYSEQDARDFIEHSQGAWRRGGSYDFAITDRETGEFLGGCGINQINEMHRYANLGYWVRTSQKGKGVATQAALLTAWFASEELKLQRVELIIQPENKGSKRVAEKLTARLEGLLRNRVNIHGTPFDAEVYSLIPSDLQK